mgnify:CR=1 FL=1
MKLNASITMAKITVQNTDISVVKYNEEDYISLTDMARSQLQDEHGNIFAKMNTSAFIVEDKIQDRKSVV